MSKIVQVTIAMHPDGRVEVQATTNQPPVVLWMLEKARGVVLGQGVHKQEKALVTPVFLVPRSPGNGGVR